MMHIIIGLFFIALGVWGVFDEWYYVVDFVKGSGSVLLIVVGALAIFAGAVGPMINREERPGDDDWPADDDLLVPEITEEDDAEDLDGDDEGGEADEPAGDDVEGDG